MIRPQTRTLLISHDVLGAKMAGPGIRYYHLSRVLRQYTDLTLAIRPQNEQALADLLEKLPGVNIVTYERGNWAALQQAAQDVDTIIISPYAAREMPQVSKLPAALVMDGYDPLLIEWLATLPPDDPAAQQERWHYRMNALFYQYLIGDFFICASERQRNWWLGQLEVAGRINPHTFHRDPSLRTLVDVVPYGLPETPPQATRKMVKGVWAGIAEDDVVLLWGGGLWPWLDPLTAVYVMASLQESHPHVKLIFPGTIHPNPDVSEHMPVQNSRVYAYAAEQGLLNRTVFFGEWVPYADWPNVLLESDIALSLHHDSIETQLAFRSRMLEYIWAGLPIVATRGDATSEIVTRFELGLVVDYGDVAGVQQAILHLLNESRSRFKGKLAAAHQELTWERAARPLIDFCQNPCRAADRPDKEAYGIPYYSRQLKQARQLINAYENGRFMRLMRLVDRIRRGTKIDR